MGVGVQEAGPGVHLQQQLGQVDARQHRLRRRPQPDQAVRFIQRVEVVDDQPGPPVRAGHDPGAGVVAGLAEPGRGLLPRRVQRDQLPGQVRRCRVGEAEPGQHVLADRFPPVTVEQQRPRIGPAVGRAGIHVAPAQRPVQAFQHAHHVRVAVHPAGRQVGIREHRPPPGPRHQLGVNLRISERFLCHPAASQLRQRAYRGQHPLPTRCRVQSSRLAQQRQERTHRVVPAGQGGAHRRVRRTVIVGHELFDQVDRVGQDGPRRDPFHRRPQCGDVEPGAGALGPRELVKQHPASEGDHFGGLLQPRQHRQPLLVRRAASRAEQSGRHQQREQVQRVIDRDRLQVPHHRDQRGGPLRLAQPSQRRGLAAQTGSGQHLHPVGRNVAHLDAAGAQCGELLRALQRLDHLRS